MGITKSDLFTDEQNGLANTAKVFAHPARIAIIQFLLKSNSCVNGTLVQELGLAQATISQHLKELKNVGIIQGTIEGASMSYCINPEKWRSIQELFANLFDKYDTNCGTSCC
jgi:predicted transcriptional regulator